MSEGDATEDRTPDEFLDWLEPRTGVTASFSRPGPHVTAILYPDCPRVGSVLGATLGLSLKPYAPGMGREVLVRVDDADPAWVSAVGYMVAELASQGAPFAVGDAYGFGDRISERSEMTAFLIGEPAAPFDTDYVLHLSNGNHIVLVQAFPLYEEEKLHFRNIPDAWLEQATRQFISSLGDDLFNVRRPVSTFREP